MLNEIEYVLTGAMNFENGTPLFRAKDQSWRDEAAMTAIVPAKDFHYQVPGIHLENGVLSLISVL